LGPAAVQRGGARDPGPAPEQKSGKKPYGAKVGLLMGGGGALLGGLPGLLIGDPIGALVGAALVGGAGYLLSKKI
jgi:hypothetical protein